VRLRHFIFGVIQEGKQSTAEDAERAKIKPGFLPGSLRPLRARR
jgi:hypothetical protein